MNVNAIFMVVTLLPSVLTRSEASLANVLKDSWAMEDIVNPLT